jgi:hypothetical protein
MRVILHHEMYIGQWINNSDIFNPENLLITLNWLTGRNHLQVASLEF